MGTAASHPRDSCEQREAKAFGESGREESLDPLAGGFSLNGVYWSVGVALSK